MNACTSACGFCGRCTDALEGPSDQPEPKFCDQCGGDAFYPVTCTLGVFCSHACADEAERQFSERMARRGFMTAEFQQRLPELVTPGMEQKR